MRMPTTPMPLSHDVMISWLIHLRSESCKKLGVAFVLLSYLACIATSEATTMITVTVLWNKRSV